MARAMSSQCPEFREAGLGNLVILDGPPAFRELEPGRTQGDFHNPSSRSVLAGTI